MHNLAQVAGVVDGEGNAHLGGADHVDGGAVGLKNLKDFAKETICQEHAGRLDLDGHDIVFGGHGLDDARIRIAVDEGAGSVRFHRVEQPHRNVGIAGGKDAGGVQDLSTEIRQLRRFVKVKVAHGRCFLHDAGVAVVHAVDIGPDLDFFGPDDSAHDAGRVVGTAAFEVVHLVAGVHADIALGDVQIGLFFLLKDLMKRGFDAFNVRLSHGVRTHEGKGRNQFHVHALLLQVGGHEEGGHQLSLGKDYALQDLREGFLRDSDKGLENAVDIGLGFFHAFLLGIQFPDYTVVFCMQDVDGLPGAVRIAVIQIAGYFHESIRRPGHGRQNNDILPSGSNDAGHLFETLCASHGGAAEFKHFHF